MSHQPNPPHGGNNASNIFNTFTKTNQSPNSEQVLGDYGQQNEPAKPASGTTNASHPLGGARWEDQTTQVPSGNIAFLKSDEWDETYANTETDGEYDQYTQMVGNDNAAVSMGPPESTVLGQPAPSWHTNSPMWGQGINGEAIPIALLPLYINIPRNLRTWEYWKKLLVVAQANMFITPQVCVDKMVGMLKRPEINPGTTFGWTHLRQAWRLFFIADKTTFVPGRVTPELWISMLTHMYTSDPSSWKLSLGTHAALAESAEKGDPSTYVSQYVPTIPTAAPLLIINPDACGPIPPDFKFDKKPFKGALASRPDLWGHFFDDGPKKENESDAEAIIRIRWARSNMGIIRRPRNRLPPLAVGSSASTDQVLLKQRDKFRAAILNENKHLARLHGEMMDKSHLRFNPKYRDAWITQQRARRTENSRRRQAAYEHAARYYKHMNRPVPPKPVEPEDSEDEYFFDPADVVMPYACVETNNSPKTREPYRCQPCVNRRRACNFRVHAFPCASCISVGKPENCVSSRPDLVERSISQAGNPTNTHPRQAYTLARPKGPFIPSFAMPPVRIEHSPSSKPSRVGQSILGGVKMKNLKRPPVIGEGVDNVENERYNLRSKKKQKTAPDNKEKETPKKKVAAKRQPPRKKDDDSFEPCHDCKRIGHPDWCEKKRPCSHCVSMGRAATCESSHQDQPYGTNPGGQGPGYNDDIFNYMGYDPQPIFSGQVPEGPEPSPMETVAAHEATPYMHLPEDAVQLYRSRLRLGDLPLDMPENIEGAIVAFIEQDRALRRDDPDYRPLTVLQNVEAYFRRTVRAIVDLGEQDLFIQANPGQWTLTERLWHAGNPMLPTAEDLAAEVAAMREAAQRVQSAAQSMNNFSRGLTIRQTNRHASDLNSTIPGGNDGMEWIYDDLYESDGAPTPDIGSQGFSYNTQSFDATMNGIFHNVEDFVDPSTLENMPGIPSAAVVTNDDIANALQEGLPSIPGVTWYLENIRAGYDVDFELIMLQRPTNPCSEDLNFWNKEQNPEFEPCAALNAVSCDSFLCVGKVSCPNCWERQKVAVQATEMVLVTSTKAWLCRECKRTLDEDRSRADAIQPMINKCYCVSQLQDTHLCNEDRVAAQDTISGKASEEREMAARLGWQDHCGKCLNNAADPTTGAWRCICCTSVVTLP